MIKYVHGQPRYQKVTRPKERNNVKDRNASDIFMAVLSAQKVKRPELKMQCETKAMRDDNIHLDSEQLYQCGNPLPGRSDAHFENGECSNAQYRSSFSRIFL